MKYIASLSGGRDSTAMTVRLLELGEPVDYIVFMDTGYELPEMYEYLEKLNTWLMLNYDKKITTLKPTTTIEEFMSIPYKEGTHTGEIRGLPHSIGMGYCTRELKIHPFKKFVKTLGDECTAYLGYVARETHRKGGNNGYKCAYPLQIWGWNEPEVTMYLKEQKIYNCLYDKFFRTGCYLCPKQNLGSWRQIYKNYPKLWEYAKQMEARAVELGAVVQTWRADGRPLVSREAEFEAAMNVPDLGIDFKWNEENVSCFC